MFVFMFEMCPKTLPLCIMLVQGRRALRQLHYDSNTEAPLSKTKNAKTFHDALPELRIYTDPRRRDATIVQEVITGGCYERPAGLRSAAWR